MRAATSWIGVALTVLALAACEGVAPPPAAPVAPSPTPSVQVATVTSVLEPPTGPITAADTTPAGAALAAAGIHTAQAGSLRMRLVAHVGSPGAARSLDVSGTGESESAARSHVVVVVTLSGRTITTESLGYDGAIYSRKENEAWQRMSKAGPASADPRNYLNFVSGSHGVVDVGPGTRGGAPAEQYQALASAADGGNRPAGPAPTVSTSPLPVKVTAWVDRDNGRLVGIDLRFPDIGAGPGSMSIDFNDFGATIKVAPPSPAP